MDYKNNLSPILFSLLLNDLSEFIAHACNGLVDVSEMSSLLLGNDDIDVFFKLYLLLYADDTVILAESKDELQAALNAMYLCCKSWDLEVNPSKTKITIFCNRKFQHIYVFSYNNQVLNIDENFVYLGIMFSYNDLSEFIAHAYNGLVDVSEMSSLLLGNDDIDVFFKLYLLLYADDTVILAESKDELQAALNAMYLCCKSWDLEVNPSKTKITIFCNRKFQHNYVFSYNNQVLNIDENFVYLGIMFSYNGRFIKTIKIG